MAVGTPVVCTDVGAMPEYVVDGKTGFIVPPGDTDHLRSRLELLLGDAELASEMGRAGAEHVRQYAWDHVAAGVAAEYRRMTSDVG
jgi:glycosyltransferase involved in cell wall biosynthesis